MTMYMKRKCLVCGKLISSNGLAWTSHNRAHVREGVLEEILDWDNRITFRKVVKPKIKRRTR